MGTFKSCSCRACRHAGKSGRFEKQMAHRKLRQLERAACRNLEDAPKYISRPYRD
jgi:hypothetical protein